MRVKVFQNIYVKWYKKLLEFLYIKEASCNTNFVITKGFFYYYLITLIGQSIYNSIYLLSVFHRSAIDNSWMTNIDLLIFKWQFVFYRYWCDYQCKWWLGILFYITEYVAYFFQPIIPSSSLTLNWYFAFVYTNKN